MTYNDHIDHLRGHRSDSTPLAFWYPCAGESTEKGVNMDLKVDRDWLEKKRKDLEDLPEPAACGGTALPAPQFGEPWSPTPWKYVPGLRNEIEDNAGNTLCFDEYFDSERCLDAVDMQRAVACVNAMANIPDPQGFVREVRELMERCWPVIKKDHDMHINSILKCDKCGKTHKRDPFYDCTLMEKLSTMLARLDAGRGSE